MSPEAPDTSKSMAPASCSPHVIGVVVTATSKSEASVSVASVLLAGQPSFTSSLYVTVYVPVGKLVTSKFSLAVVDSTNVPSWSYTSTVHVASDALVMLNPATPVPSQPGDTAVTSN